MEKVVSASILGLENKTSVVNNLVDKGVNYIHYDVMDNTMIPRVSLPPEEIFYIRDNAKDHIFDIHLMVRDPEKYIQKYAPFAQYLTFHYEMESIDNIKKILRTYGGKHNIGIAINPSTNAEEIFEFIHDVSHILVMSVIPGKGGQSFIPESLEKIKKIKSYIEKTNSKAFIQVDGGVNDVTGPQCIQAGASSLVSGSFLIKNINDEKIIKKIKGCN